MNINENVRDVKKKLTQLEKNNKFVNATPYTFYQNIVKIDEFSIVLSMYFYQK